MMISGYNYPLVDLFWYMEAEEVAIYMQVKHNQDPSSPDYKVSQVDNAFLYRMRQNYIRGVLLISIGGELVAGTLCSLRIHFTGKGEPLDLVSATIGTGLFLFISSLSTLRFYPNECNVMGADAINGRHAVMGRISVLNRMLELASPFPEELVLTKQFRNPVYTVLRIITEYTTLSEQARDSLHLLRKIPREQMD